MVQINERIAALGKSQLEAFLRAADVYVANAQKLADLQLKWSKTTYEDSAKALRQIASVKDVSEFVSYGTVSVQTAWDKATADAKTAYEYVSTVQADCSNLVEAQVDELKKNVAVTLDAALKSAPAGSERVVSTVKSALESAGSVYESLVKAARHASTAAEANLNAVGAQVTAAAKKKVAA